MKDKNEIQILGSGCPACKRLFELTKQAVQELGIDANVEYVTDIQKIIEIGVMQSPVLVLNGKPIMTGPVSDIEAIKERITDDSETHVSGARRSCNCGGDC